MVPTRTLDGHAAGGGRVEEQVHEVVVEEVDLVDVEDAPVGAGQEPRLVLDPAVGERALQVERAEDPVLGGAHGQFDQAHRAGLDPGPGRERTVRGERRGLGRIAGEAVARDDVDGRQHVGQGPHGGGLRGALLAPHEDPADLRRHRGQDQGEGHVVEP
jgi:hypothetical protein